MKPLQRTATTAAALILFGMSAVFGYACYLHFVGRRDCFNTLGRCYDATDGVVYHEQAGAVWLMLAILTLLPAIYLTRRLMTRKR